MSVCSSAASERGAGEAGLRAGACRNRCSSASKLDAQRPHRTQPEDTLSWSLTTRKAVPQAGQRVASVMRA